MTPQVETHIRLGIHSVFPSDQSPRCPHEETLGPYLPIAKFIREILRVSPRNITVFLHELSQGFSVKFLRENPRRNK